MIITQREATKGTDKTLKTQTDYQVIDSLGQAMDLTLILIRKYILFLFFNPFLLMLYLYVWNS